MAFIVKWQQISCQHATTHIYTYTQCIVSLPYHHLHTSNRQPCTIKSTAQTTGKWTLSSTLTTATIDNKKHLLSRGCVEVSLCKRMPDPSLLWVAIHSYHTGGQHHPLDTGRSVACGQDVLHALESGLHKHLAGCLALGHTHDKRGCCVHGNGVYGGQQYLLLPLECVLQPKVPKPT